VPPGDTDALATALEVAVTARDRWPAMGEAGRALALRCFNWTAIERGLVEAYESVLSTRTTNR
jgi:glycosyltransferase involved in cell wall biosynthesis